MGKLFKRKSRKSGHCTTRIVMNLHIFFTAVWVWGTAVAVGIAVVVISTSVIGYFVRRHLIQHKLTNDVDKETLN